MQIPGLERRIFSYSDLVMFQIAHVIRDCFHIDLADFTAFDLDLNAAYHTNLVNLIVAAEDAPDHEYLMDQLAQKTVIVEENMTLCRNTTQLMKPFIEKAFPGKKATWNLFGYDDYDDARNSQHKMYNFMKKLYKTAILYAAELIAAGFTQIKIDKLQTCYLDLMRADDEQESFKIEIKKMTNERIEMLNAVWSIVLNICRIGKLIYADNYGKYQQYVLYHSSSEGEPDVFHGNVPAEQTVVVLEENITPTTMFKLINKGTTILQFCLEDTHNPCVEGVELNPDEEQDIIANELGAGTILKCTNKSTDTEGMYEVEVS